MAGAYANALVEVAQKTSSLEAVHSDVDTLASVLKDNAVRTAACLLPACFGCYSNSASASGRPACRLKSKLQVARLPVAPLAAAESRRPHAAPIPFAASYPHPHLTCRIIRCCLSQAVLVLLSNPVISEDRKKDVVKKLASEAGFSQYTVNFLNLLIDQNRVEALEDICESFEKSYCALTDTQVGQRDSVCGCACGHGWLRAETVR